MTQSRLAKKKEPSRAASGTAEMLLQRIQDLPPMPFVVSRIVDLTRTTNSNLTELARLIASDQALTAKVLRVVNSASMAQREPIYSVRQAVYVIGFDQTRVIAVGLGALGMLKAGAPSITAVQKRVWMQAFTRSHTAIDLAIRREVDDSERDLLFVAGLLADIGRLFLLYALGDGYLNIAGVARSERVALAEVENRVLGISSGALGHQIALRWDFPERLVRLIGCGDPCEAAKPNPEDPNPVEEATRELLILADYVCRAAFPSTLETVPPAKPIPVLRSLGLPVLELERLVEAMWQQTSDFVSELCDLV